ncbi:hypothetical protein Tco_0047040 [Tanacetum coccineum]
MTTLADKSLLSGGDNKPPMLEKHLYDSWKSRMELYMMNRPHGRMILASVEKEIYALVSQHRYAKDLWEKIKLLMQGTSLTKQEQEFNTEISEPLPNEWSKLLLMVKLVKDLHTTNVDQLHAHLEQHERHANEVRLMHERNSDPLALVASHQITQSPYQNYQQTYQITQPQPPSFNICTVITKVPLLFAVTMSNTLDQSTSTYVTISSESKWKIDYRECMRTRSQARRLRQHHRQQQQVPPNLVEPPKDTMADNRTMAELLQAPTEGYEDAIVLYPNVPYNINFKLMLYPFTLEGQPDMLEKEPPSINSDMAWDRFKDLLRACPHHGFSELHQLDTFYNALNVNDQDSLNSAAGGNFLDKRPADCSSIIESKSKVRHSRSKAIVAKVSTSASTSGVSPDVAELKDMVRALLLDKQTSPVPAPAPVKAVEQSCVTCGGAHSYRNCPATDGNNYRDNIQEYISQAAATNFNQGNSGYRPPPMANQIRPPGFPPMQHNSQANNQNRWNQNQNQNRGNGYNQGQIQRPQVQQHAPMYQPPVNQHPAYQAPAHQASGVSKTDFESYVKANDAVMQNMQNQMSNITDLLTKIVNSQPTLLLQVRILFLATP